MNTKKLIERNLKFTSKYVYLDITRGSIESGMLTYCDNCGKLITNMVKVVEEETGKRFTIGTDCAETLRKAKCLYNNGTQTDFCLDIYSYNKAAKVATELRKGKEYGVMGFTVYVFNDKQKSVECFIHDLQKFFPELIKS